MVIILHEVFARANLLLAFYAGETCRMILYSFDGERRCRNRLLTLATWDSCGVLLLLPTWSAVQQTLLIADLLAKQADLARRAYDAILMILLAEQFLGVFIVVINLLRANRAHRHALNAQATRSGPVAGVGKTSQVKKSLLECYTEVGMALGTQL